MPAADGATASHMSRTLESRSRAVLFGQAFLLWTTVGAVFAATRLSGSVGWREPVLFSLAQWWSWGVIAPAIIAADERLPWEASSWARRLGVHLVIAVVVTALYIVIFAAMAALFGVRPWSRLTDGSLWSDALQGLFLWSLVVYLLIVGVWTAHVQLQRRLAAELHAERLQGKFAQARLEALRMQIDPHFLFNALNTISAQVEAEPRQARRMIEHLGDLMRASLASENRSDVTLGEELGLLEHYLAIQRLRFGERMNVALTMEAGVEHAVVPSLILQPLVENAIRHGVGVRARGGSIWISARRFEGRLLLRVEDDGVGLPESWTRSTHAGVGLLVTTERVEAVDKRSRLEVKARVGGGTEVSIDIPWIEHDQRNESNA